ncbi:hypothetical protein Tco_0732804 [Tanacetum coccineum]
MANLRYSDKHNMVAFLKKPTESVGFTKIVEFLKGTSLRYALTHNPTIYDSLVKQFWQSATVRTLVNGIQELVASIDNKEYTITEASIRSQLQLADATGAAPDQGEGSAIPAGSQTTHDLGTEIPQSQGPTITPVADEATTTSVGVETEGATTTTSGLDTGMDSGNIHESPLRSHEAPFPEGNTSGSAEDNLNLKELIDIVPKLVLRIDNLEKELFFGQKFHGRIVTPKKVSALGEAQEEDISPTTLEAAETLSKVASQNVSTYKRRARSTSKGKDIGIGMDFFSATKERLNSAEVEVNTEVNPGSAGVNTGNTLVSTPSVIQTVNVIVPSPVKIQRERKAPMTSEDVQATQKTKEQIRQEETDLAEAMRLQDLQDEEDARQKRKAEVQEAAQFYTEEDWDTIRAKLEANAELTRN